ncbi:hypothetical protein KR009_009269 [Drosophila setifemur]|nr:hypothetical protein KR009_009269 [Drosophila setifemur]
MRVLYWICWILIIGCVFTAKRDFRVIFDDVGTQIFKAGTLDTFACQVYQKNNRSCLSCQVLTRRNVHKVTVRAFLEFMKKNMRLMKLFDERFDGCLFFNTVQKNPLLKIFSQALDRFSNLTCPLKANLSYNVEYFYLSEEDLPSFTPTGTFRCLAEFFVNQSMITRVIIRGKVIPWH